MANFIENMSLDQDGQKYGIMHKRFRQDSHGEENTYRSCKTKNLFTIPYIKYTCLSIY